MWKPEYKKNSLNYFGMSSLSEIVDGGYVNDCIRLADIQLRMAAGRTVNVNATMAPDRKTCAESIRSKNACRGDVFISHHNAVGLGTLPFWLSDQSVL